MAQLVIKETKVKKQGNGVGIYIPSKIRKELEIGEGDTVYLTAEDKKVIITNK